MNVRLRLASEADQNDVGVLHHRSRAAAYAHLLPADAFTSRGHEALGEWWAERFRWERETHRMTLAEDDGELVGFTYVGPSETEGAVELYAIHVAPERVGTGVGRTLMIDALAGLAEAGGDRAVLWVLEDNVVARTFYENGGWVPDGGSRVGPINGRSLPQLRYAHPL
ncbi:GNAT family N-acetyltransferase [Actinoplanes sp. NPDC051851]|uniref:GNAT family N-acetyltransferase n=1 Tax=Actinoplanes sp. NPDC051851 TaxID=3154753 RepID=UPI00341CCBCB